jgi:hypothetical protein
MIEIEMSENSYLLLQFWRPLDRHQNLYFINLNRSRESNSCRACRAVEDHDPEN